MWRPCTPSAIKAAPSQPRSRNGSAPPPPPEELNEAYDLIVVCSELDPGTERIPTYVAEGFGGPINVVFLRYDRDGEREDLTRTWERCRRYGFISAGGGKGYTQTLSSLKPGNRVFVYIPDTGHVGVGKVIAPIVPGREAEVEVNGRPTRLLKEDLKAKNMGELADDSEKTEKVGRVRWLKAVPQSEASGEKGLIAKQHSACRLRNEFTTEKVTHHFGRTEQGPSGSPTVSRSYA